MKLRIATWSLLGFLISGIWFLYATSRTVPLTASDWLWMACKITQPILLLSWNHALYFYWVFLANAVTYALIGLLVEGLRQRLHRAT